MPGRTARMPRNGPTRFTASTRSNSARVLSSISLWWTMAALCTRIVGAPNTCVASRITAAQSSSLDTSRCTKIADSPISAASLPPRSSWMSAMTTFAPSAANSRASAAPCPDAPPVMMATLPSSMPMAVTHLSFWIGLNLTCSDARIPAAAIPSVERGIALGADGTAGQWLAPEDHDLWLLVGGQLRAAVVDDLGLGQFAGSDDDGDDVLPPVGVRPTDDGGLPDERVRLENPLDLRRENVLRPGLDEPAL